jgi:glycosyltransferase involved in cell wall biosynthesis
MKLAFLSYGFGSEVSGSGKYGFYLANGLRKLGVQVDVFRPKFIFKTFGMPMFALENCFLRLSDYDVVHSNEGCGVFKHHNCMIDTYHHDYKQTNDINSLTFHNLEMIQCHRVRHIIVPSYSTKKSLLSYGFDQNRISVIPHGVDHNIFAKNGSREKVRKKYGLSNKFVIITVGKLIRRKQHLDIVHALAGIDNAVLILVGKGEEESNIKRTCRQKKVNLIQFKRIPEKFLVDLYNAADVYVHSSIVEGFGLTVLEAMACGLPVICSDVADYRYMVNKAGIVLKLGETSGMHDAILRLKDNSSERLLMSQIAEEESAEYTWAKSAKAHLDVYVQSLNELRKKTLTA